MTEFWKSQAKKYCDVCSCWLADQKASREAHEQGKRHQENVQRRIAEARKKSKEVDSNQRQQASVIAAMERAAAESMLKDIRDNPELRGRFGLTAEQEEALVRKASDESARREKEAERELEKQRISNFIGEKLKGNAQTGVASDPKATESDKAPTSSTAESAASSSTKIKFRAPKASAQAQPAEQQTTGSHPFGAWVPTSNALTQPKQPTVELQLPTSSSDSMQSRLREAHEVKSALLNADTIERVALIESGAKRSAVVGPANDEAPVAFKRSKNQSDIKVKREIS